MCGIFVYRIREHLGVAQFFARNDGGLKNTPVRRVQIASEQRRGVSTILFMHGGEIDGQALLVGRTAKRVALRYWSRGIVIAGHHPVRGYASPEALLGR